MDAVAAAFFAAANAPPQSEPTVAAATSHASIQDNSTVEQGESKPEAMERPQPATDASAPASADEVVAAVKIESSVEQMQNTDKADEQVVKKTNPAEHGLPQDILAALLPFMHGFPSCAVDMAAAAFSKDLAAKQPPAASGKAAKPPSKKAIEQTIKATCKNFTAVPSTEEEGAAAAAAAAAAGAGASGKAKGKGKGKAEGPKVWAVLDAAWAEAGLQPQPLVAQDVAKPVKAPKQAKAEPAAAGASTNAVEAGHEDNQALPQADQAAASEGAAPMQTTDAVAAAVDAAPGPGPSEAVLAQAEAPAPEAPQPAPASPAPVAAQAVGSPAKAAADSLQPVAGAAPSGDPIPQADPRASTYQKAVRDSSRAALTAYCGFTQGEGEEVHRTTILGPFYNEQHVQSLLSSCKQEQESCAEPPSTFPDKHVALLAFLVQGASAPLAQLAPQVATAMGLSESIVRDKLVLIADRKAYGLPKKGALSCEDDTPECLWRWEVANQDHLMLPLAAEAQEEPMPQQEAEPAESEAKDKEGKPRGRSSAAQALARRLITTVKKEVAGLKALGDHVKAAGRLVELLTPPAKAAGKASKPWAVDEAKVAQATEAYHKAARALEEHKDKEKAEAEKAALKEKERADKEAKAREEKERKEREKAAEKEAKEREKAEAKAKEEEAKRKALAPSQKMFSAFFKTTGPKPAQEQAAPAPAPVAAAAAAVSAGAAAQPAQPAQPAAAAASSSSPSVAAAPAPAAAPKPVSIVDTTSFDLAMGLGQYRGQARPPATVQADFKAWCGKGTQLGKARRAAAGARKAQRRVDLQAAIERDALLAMAKDTGSDGVVDLTGEQYVDSPLAKLASIGLAKGLCRYKFLGFHSTEHRPAYFGTWSATRAAKRLATAAAQTAGASSSEEAEPDAESWDPSKEGAGQEDERPQPGQEPAEPETAQYIDMTGRGRLSARKPFGVCPALFDYEVDSEAEWEERDNDPDDVTDLEKESAADEEEEEEEEEEGEVEGDDPNAKKEDALDYTDGWLCPDDVVEVDQEALARDKAARAGAVGAADDFDEDGVPGARVPGDESDSDCLSDDGRERDSALNPAAMPGASSALLATLGKDEDGHAAKRRRTGAPGRISIADLRDFAFGVTYDLEAYLATATSDLGRAAADLLASKVHPMCSAVPLLAPPRMSTMADGEVPEVEADAKDKDKDGAKDGAGNEAGKDGQGEAEDKPKRAKVAKEPKAPKEKATVPEELLAVLVPMVHGSNAALAKIRDEFMKRPEVLQYYGQAQGQAGAGASSSVPMSPPPAASLPLPKSLVDKKIRDITARGKWGYSNDKAGQAQDKKPEDNGAGAGASSSALPAAAEGAATDGPAGGSPGAVLAPVPSEPSLLDVDLDTWVRAVMHAEGKNPAPTRYQVIRYVVLPSVLEATGFSLRPDLEAAAAEVVAWVKAKEAKTGAAPGKTAIPSHYVVSQFNKAGEQAVGASATGAGVAAGEKPAAGTKRPADSQAGAGAVKKSRTASSTPVGPGKTVKQTAGNIASLLGGSVSAPAAGAASASGGSPRSTEAQAQAAPTKAEEQGQAAQEQQEAPQQEAAPEGGSA